MMSEVQLCKYLGTLEALTTYLIFEVQGKLFIVDLYVLGPSLLQNW